MIVRFSSNCSIAYEQPDGAGKPWHALFSPETIELIKARFPMDIKYEQMEGMLFPFLVGLRTIPSRMIPAKDLLNVVKF